MKIDQYTSSARLHRTALAIAAMLLAGSFSSPLFAEEPPADISDAEPLPKGRAMNPYENTFAYFNEMFAFCFDEVTNEGSGIFAVNNKAQYKTLTKGTSKNGWNMFQIKVDGKNFHIAFDPANAKVSYGSDAGGGRVNWMPQMSALRLKRGEPVTGVPTWP